MKRAMTQVGAMAARWGVAGLWMSALPAVGQTVQEASAPQGVTVSIYDTGMALISEARRVSLAAGENDIVMRNLPARLDPASPSFGSSARTAPFDLLEQRYHYDLLEVDGLLRRMAGQPVAIPVAGQSREGILLSGPITGATGRGEAFLPVQARDGRSLWMMDAGQWSSISFPFGRDLIAAEPQLHWLVRARQEGPQNFRLVYRTDGMEWRAAYELLMTPDSAQADFNARVEVVNRSGGSFEQARVRLLLTEKGLSEPLVPEREGALAGRAALRYAYGSNQESFERSVASLAPVEMYELPRTVGLASDRSTFVQLAQSSTLPIQRFYVYDGVRFDRFQRNRKTDWNFGTEYHSSVQTHVEFQNEERFGLGMNLPPGVCRLYTLRADGTVDLLGEEQLGAIPVGGKGYVRVGPARGLSGERERTGYVEVKPHHVYEESFQVRLANTSEQDVEIRVVEHLYRWPEYQIVRADADYTSPGPQRIEFLVALKPGGRRSINYTVRYTW